MKLLIMSSFSFCHNTFNCLIMNIDTFICRDLAYFCLDVIKVNLLQICCILESLNRTLKRYRHKNSSVILKFYGDSLHHVCITIILHNNGNQQYFNSLIANKEHLYQTARKRSLILLFNSCKFLFDGT